MNVSKIFVEICFSFYANLQLKLQKIYLQQRNIFPTNLTGANDRHITCVVFSLT